MTDWMIAGLLFAQDNGGAKPGAEFNFPWPLIVIFIGLGYFIVFRPQQREKARRRELLGALKKNDRVVTIGGIIGTIANISQDGDEVTIKVDDNTRIRILRSSIQGPKKAESESESD